jgi:hypothetical protein
MAVDSQRCSSEHGRDNPTLSGSLLPTPTARDGSGRGFPGPDYITRTGRPLDETVLKLLPPRASDTDTSGRRASEGFRPPLS